MGVSHPHAHTQNQKHFNLEEKAVPDVEDTTIEINADTPHAEELIEHLSEITRRQARKDEIELRVACLDLAIQLQHGRDFDFPGREGELLIRDYEDVAIGSAERLLEWVWNV